MKVVAISDLHGYLPKDLPPGDILCICGDIVPLDYQSNNIESTAWFCLDFLPWTDALPYKKVIFIAGNHDFFLEDIGPKHGRSASEVLKKLLPGEHKKKHKLIYLQDNSVEIEGKRFYGTPWIEDLSRWAFYRPVENTLEYGRGLKELYNNIPKKCDVILTHMPPRIGLLGRVLETGKYNTGADYGSATLADVLTGRQFQYLCCGHVHSGQHIPFNLGNADGRFKYDRQLVNVSIKTEDYHPYYESFVFDI